MQMEEVLNAAALSLLFNFAELKQGNLFLNFQLLNCSTNTHHLLLLTEATKTKFWGSAAHHVELNPSTLPIMFKRLLDTLHLIFL